MPRSPVIHASADCAVSKGPEIDWDLLLTIKPGWSHGLHHLLSVMAAMGMLTIVIGVFLMIPLMMGNAAYLHDIRKRLGWSHRRRVVHGIMDMIPGMGLLTNGIRLWHLEDAVWGKTHATRIPAWLIAMQAVVSWATICIAPLCLAMSIQTHQYAIAMVGLGAMGWTVYMNARLIRGLHATMVQSGS
jgi:hypothetical protein